MRLRLLRVRGQKEKNGVVCVDFEVWTCTLRMLGSRTFGPRDENCAITGDGRTSTTVVEGFSTAVGLEVELM